MLKSSTYEAQKTDDEYRLLSWLIDCKSDAADTRDHIQLAIAQGGWIHRCNGAMLKSVRVAIDDGAYLPIKKGGMVILKYVKGLDDCSPKTPDFSKLHETAIRTESLDCPFGEIGWMQALSKVIIGSRAALNSVYFASLCCGFNGRIHHGGPDDGVLFMGAAHGGDVDQIGMLMPIKQ